jgi:hypothetical protein
VAVEKEGGQRHVGLAAASASSNPFSPAGQKQKDRKTTGTASGLECGKKCGRAGIVSNPTYQPRRRPCLRWFVGEAGLVLVRAVRVTTQVKLSPPVTDLYEGEGGYFKSF